MQIRFHWTRFRSQGTARWTHGMHGRRTPINVGDTVYANIGEFTEGRILKCWDQGNPYRVEIQNDEKSNVWVPIDSDHFVRSSI